MRRKLRLTGHGSGTARTARARGNASWRSAASILARHHAARLVGRQAVSSDRVEQHLNLFCGANKLVAPEVVAGVADELDEGDEQAPGVRLVDNEALDQHASDLLLNHILVRLREEEQEHAAEVVRVRVGVPQLVGEGVQEVVPPLGVQIPGQPNEHVHRRRRSERALRCGLGLGLHDGLRPHGQHQRVDQRHVVPRPGLLGEGGVRVQQPSREGVHELGWGLAGLEERLQVVAHGGVGPRGGQRRHNVGTDAGWLVDVWEQVHLEVRGEGVRGPDVAREGRQDEVAHLDAARGDDVAQGEVVLAQELREVVQEHEEDTERAAVQHGHGLGELGVAQVLLQKAEQVNQQPMEGRPALCVLRVEKLGHEEAVRDKLEPRKGEARDNRGTEGVERIADALQHLQVDRLKPGVGGGEVGQEVVHQAVVGLLVERRAAGLGVVDHGADVGGEDLCDELDLVLQRLCEELDEQEDHLGRGLDGCVVERAVGGRGDAALHSHLDDGAEEALRRVVTIEEVLLLELRNVRRAGLLVACVRCQPIVEQCGNLAPHPGGVTLVDLDRCGRSGGRGGLGLGVGLGQAAGGLLTLAHRLHVREERRNCLAALALGCGRAQGLACPAEGGGGGPGVVDDGLLDQEDANLEGEVVTVLGDELGQVGVQVRVGKQTAACEGEDDLDVEAALGVGVAEPSGEFLHQLGAALPQPLEQRDKGLPQQAGALVEQSTECLLGDADGDLVTRRRRGDQGHHLADQPSHLVVGRQRRERCRGRGTRRRLLELTERSGALLQRLRHGHSGGTGSGVDRGLRLDSTLAF
mmetsp:Transcript_65769/g.143570  ORF Transcript_65769/g.143570 Transcript_65769/m.143570 type:complete len:807 (-) Transcript_65769:493-2913(-)